MSYKPTVAVLGSSGFLGEPTFAAFERRDLVDKIQFPVKALTRDIKTKKDTAAVRFVEGDLTKESKERVIQELEGTDVIIELLTADVKLFEIVESIVAEVKPKVFIPSQFGTDVDAAQESLPGFLDIKSDHSAAIRKLGVKVVDVYTSHFFSPGAFLYEIVPHIGIDKEANTITYIGDPENKVSVTSTTDIGHAVASLAAIEPSKLPDTIRIESDKVSFQQFRQRYESDHNVSLKEQRVSAQDALKEAQEKYSKSNAFDLNDFFHYLHVIAGQGSGKGLSFTQNNNELVNPDGQLWSWSSY